jgi:hypothetical protein
MNLLLVDVVDTDYMITYTNEDGVTQVIAVIEDEPGINGVFLVTVTLTKTGVYNLQILLRGLQVPNGLQ